MNSRSPWRSAAFVVALLAGVATVAGAGLGQSGYDRNQCVESWEDGTWRGGKVYRLRGSQLHLMLNRAAERARQNGAPGYYYETATHSTTERRDNMGRTTSMATYIGIRVLLGPRVSDPPSGLYLNAASWQNDPKVPECDFERQTGPAPNLP